MGERRGDRKILEEIINEKNFNENYKPTDIRISTNLKPTKKHYNPIIQNSDKN